MEPFIIDHFGRNFKIARETYIGRQYWSAKRGEWLYPSEWKHRSKFRSREAAELELKRIKLGMTPDVPKRKVNEASE